MVRGRPKSFDTDEVLDRAMEVFRARGYEATCMPTLLEHMGIGRQSLYDTFGDKEHLFKAALKRYLDKFYLKLMEILDRPGSKLDNIESLLRYMSPNYDQGKTSCLAVNASAEFGSEDPEIADFLKRHYDRMAIALENALESARQAGELKPDINPGAMGRWLVNNMNGLALMGRVGMPQSFINDVLTHTLSTLK